MKTKNTRKGFTTVELVIVIAVIAILATVLIPTFSNMIESANLSVDKQAVRNMNVCLAGSKIIYNDPSAAGNVRSYLREYGYGTEDNFKTKSENHGIYWYVDKVLEDGVQKDISVILLVNTDTKTVVYPEEYTDLLFVGQPNGVLEEYQNLYDLSKPFMKIGSSEGEVTIEKPEIYYSGRNIQMDQNVVLNVQYTFDALDNAEDLKDYSTWNATFIATVDLPSNYNGKAVDIAVAGQYGDFSWQPLALIDMESGKSVDLLNDMVGQTINCSELTLIGTFTCGVVSAPDTTYLPADFGGYSFSQVTFIGKDNNGNSKGDEVYTAPPTGTVLNIELRLENPENTAEYEVAGTFSYTFQ